VKTTRHRAEALLPTSLGPNQALTRLDSGPPVIRWTTVARDLSETFELTTAESSSW
jgi:hypothetical protein